MIQKWQLVFMTLTKIRLGQTYVGPYDFRDAENVDGIQSLKQNLQFNAECSGICQSLDKWIKSR